MNVDFQIIFLHFQTPPGRSSLVAASNLGGTKYESRLEPELDLEFEDECEEEDEDDEGGFDPWAVVPPTRFD